MRSRLVVSLRKCRSTICNGCSKGVSACPWPFQCKGILDFPSHVLSCLWNFNFIDGIFGAKLNSSKSPLYAPIKADTMPFKNQKKKADTMNSWTLETEAWWVTKIEISGVGGGDNDMYDIAMGYTNNALQCNILCFTFLWYFSNLILVIWFNCMVAWVIRNLVIDAC